MTHHDKGDHLSGHELSRKPWSTRRKLTSIRKKLTRNRWRRQRNSFIARTRLKTKVTTPKPPIATPATRRSSTTWCVVVDPIPQPIDDGDQNDPPQHRAAENAHYKQQRHP